MFCWFDGKGNSVKLKLQKKAPDINYVHTKRHFRNREIENQSLSLLNTDTVVLVRSRPLDRKTKSMKIE